MEALINTWIWAPLGVLVLNAFKAELGKLFATFMAWCRRVFEIGDKATLWNYATGDWGATVTVVDYVWCFNGERRGVYVDWPGRGIVKLGILQWVNWFKFKVKERL